MPRNAQQEKRFKKTATRTPRSHRAFQRRLSQEERREELIPRSSDEEDSSSE